MWGCRRAAVSASMSKHLASCWIVGGRSLYSGAKRALMPVHTETRSSGRSSVLTDSRVSFKLKKLRAAFTCGDSGSAAHSCMSRSIALASLLASVLSNAWRAALGSECTEVGVEGVEVEESEGPNPLDLRMEAGLVSEFDNLEALRLEGGVVVSIGLLGRLAGPGLAGALAPGLGLAPILLCLGCRAARLVGAAPVPVLEVSTLSPSMSPVVWGSVSNPRLSFSRFRPQGLAGSSWSGLLLPTESLSSLSTSWVTVAVMKRTCGRLLLFPEESGERGEPG
mmetsp:Transcript_152802/g.266947  ORF Transcript_152802/g.266947 Transcript_152802/m.266947 type:complete len:280 (-) Transcript_152802:441-1280(-)